ncbi:ribonuclease H-like domain-containing protein [Scenedesmus sp. NREL 46B-D3]|nr:ribonuclease H-like domain-containing protein [Scenedesmus sp. NREL 46B-D3]
MPGALVLDTEFNTQPFRLISAGFVRLGKHGEQRACAYFLIRPGGFSINERGHAFAVHKITQHAAATQGVHMHELMSWLASVLPRTTSLVGHNVKRDIQLLREEAVRAGADPLVAKCLGKLPVHDTMPMARARGMKPLSLQSVHGALFGGTGTLPDAHNALADATYTAAVFNKLFDTSQVWPIAAAFFTGHGSSCSDSAAN